jgi:Holliday junction resolvase RusA-like endonuclease
MRQTLSFRAYGTPRPQGSKRYVGNGRFIEASDVKPWRNAIKNAVFEENVASGDDRQFTEPVVVHATFYMPRPKSVKRPLPTVPPDLDKLCRALGDALSVDSKVIEDDSLIVHWNVRKVYAAAPEQAGVKVTVDLLSETQLETLRSIAVIDELFPAPTCKNCGEPIED